MVEPIYFKDEQQSQKNIPIPFNGHATLHTIQQAIVPNRTSDKLIRYMFLIGYKMEGDTPYRLKELGLETYTFS
jgi:hypothetical protein